MFVTKMVNVHKFERFFFFFEKRVFKFVGAFCDTNSALCLLMALQLMVSQNKALKGVVSLMLDFYFAVLSNGHDLNQ